MSVDPYSPCPCGSGKKLKFCCSDLVHEIEKIEKLVTGEQPHAALRFVEQLLQKQPERASLLDMKASLELALEEFDTARETIQQYLALHPDNPSAYGQAAMMAAAKGETAAAVGALQAALERIEGDNMPQRVFEAVGAVGHGLLVAGDIIAARGHFVLYAGIAPKDENLGIEMLLRMNLEGNPPLVLRDQLLLADAPAGDETWVAAFEEANRQARRGMWQRAEAEYVNLVETSGTAPEVVYNLALVRGWLGDTPQFAAGLRQFARLDVAWDDAIEAEAVAQLVDPSADEPTIASEQWSYEISDAQQAVEQLLADKRVETIAAGQGADEEELGQARDRYLLLDRPAAHSGAELAVDEVPNVHALFTLLGKRTDREAQLIVAAEGDQQCGEVRRVIEEVLGDLATPTGDPEVIAEKPVAEIALSWRWRLPDDTPPDQRRELLAQRRRRAVLTDWPQAAQGALEGKSPLEAADDPSLRVALGAAELLVEQAAVDPTEEALFRELRQQLQLPAATPIDPNEIDVERLPIIRTQRLRLADATNQQLETLLSRAVMTGANLATLTTAKELITRHEDDPEQPIDLGRAYRQLIRSEPDPEQAVAWVGKAKAWAARVGRSAAEWSILALELQLERFNPEGVKAELAHIEANHIQEPGVAEAVYRLLYSAGLGPLLQPSDDAQPRPAAPAAPDGPGIWTPDAPPPREHPESPSAIWTP